jgi:M6 family metalloprotease-like protein
MNAWRHEVKPLPRRAGRQTLLVLLACLANAWGGPALALEPPPAGSVQKYRTTGRLPQLVAKAKAGNNHKVAPQLALRAEQRLRSLLAPTPGSPTPAPAPAPAPLSARGYGLPSLGNVKIPALLIAFKDYPATVPVDTVRSILFGDGISGPPHDSLRNFYRRSSYGNLEIDGSVLGWYTTAYNRSQVAQTTEGREKLIQEALNYYDQQGHDFSQYDNDQNGQIDYLAVMWTGPAGDWATFWWGWNIPWADGSFKVDGKTLGNYSWQWEDRDPRVVIHETGHALGLPDYYDYDDAIGPRGGVGGLDIMDGGGDHNCFSKFLLGWVTPYSTPLGEHVHTLRPTTQAPECRLVATTCSARVTEDQAFSEYFLIENRTRGTASNDTGLPGDGFLVWHVDARMNDSKTGFRYDNSYTEHKLLRVMEADGLEEIEKGRGGNAGDYWAAGKEWSSTSTPSCNYYSGEAGPFAVSFLSPPGDPMQFRFRSDTSDALCKKFDPDRYTSLKALCKLMGCLLKRKPWVDRGDPDPWIREALRGRDAAKAKQVRALQQEAMELASQAERGSLADTARIEARATALRAQLKQLGYRER